MALDEAQDQLSKAYPNPTLYVAVTEERNCHWGKWTREYHVYVARVAASSHIVSEYGPDLDAVMAVALAKAVKEPAHAPA